MLIRGSWKIQEPDIQQWLETAEGLSVVKKDDIKKQTPALGGLPIYVFIFLGDECFMQIITHQLSFVKMHFSA